MCMCVYPCFVLSGTPHISMELNDDARRVLQKYRMGWMEGKPGRPSSEFEPGTPNGSDWKHSEMAGGKGQGKVNKAEKVERLEMKGGRDQESKDQHSETGASPQKKGWLSRLNPLPLIRRGKLGGVETDEEREDREEREKVENAQKEWEEVRLMHCVDTSTRMCMHNI